MCCGGECPITCTQQHHRCASQARQISVHVCPQEGASAEVAPPAAARSWRQPVEPAGGPAVRAASTSSPHAAQRFTPFASAAYGPLEQSGSLPKPKLSCTAAAATPDSVGVTRTTSPKAECAIGSCSISDDDQQPHTVSSRASSLHPQKLNTAHWPACKHMWQHLMHAMVHHAKMHCAGPLGLAATPQCPPADCDGL